MDSDKDALREMVKAFLSAFAFVLAVALLAALVCGLTGCADGGELTVDENPPAPLQTRTYDMELEELPWKATKVYDATSGQSWWLLRRVNSSNYLVLEGGGNVSVG